MKKKLLKTAAFLLALCMILPLAACGQKEEEGTKQTQAQGVQAEDLFYTLMTTVKFDQTLTDQSFTAEYIYSTMPAGAQIIMYKYEEGSCKDELTWIRLAQESDMAAAIEAVNAHLEEVKYDASRYYPSELPKVEAANYWNNGGSGKDIILCISNDYETAGGIMTDSSKVLKKPAGVTYGEAPEATDPVINTDPNQNTDSQVTDPPETQPPVTEPPVVGYPVITSKSGTWRDCGNAMIVDDMAYEYYNYSENSAKNYAKIVSRLGQQLQGEADVYCLIIPTAVGVVFPDDLAAKYPGYEDQGARLEEIYGMMDSSVIPVNIFDKMMQHRDEYLYYRTDWHWSGIGAYYGYERFCEVKGIAPYTMDQRTEHIYEGYLGPLYSQTCNKDAALAANPDTVYAYEPYYEEYVTMVYTDTNGNRISQEVIADGDAYGTGLKYLIFAAGDQPITEFTNSQVTDGSVAIVIKESFGNAMMSYFVDHYSKVYEIDYRHWRGNLAEFAREVGADDIIFANNIGMVRSSDRIGELARLIP